MPNNILLLAESFTVVVSAGDNSSLNMSQATFSSFGNPATDRMEEIDESGHFVPLASSSKSLPRSPAREPNESDLHEESDTGEVVENLTVTVATASPTVHQQPDWVQLLKDNFCREIVSPCSFLTVSAVNENLYIQVGFKIVDSGSWIDFFILQNAAQHKFVKEELVNMVMSKVQCAFGGAGLPGKRIVHSGGLKRSNLFILR